MNIPTPRQAVYISLIIAGIITVFFTGRGILVGDHVGLFDVAMSMFYSFTVSLLLFILDIAGIRWLIRNYPYERNIMVRVVLELLMAIINAAIVAPLVFLLSLGIHHLFVEAYEYEKSIILDQIAITVMINIIMIMLFEGRHIFLQWRESLLHAEVLRRKHAESRYEALRNQISPHFLFNSLNVLTELIDESSEKSKDFIERFSRIYRYILETHEAGVASVAEELKFLKDYFFLQEVRHGKSISLDLDIEAAIIPGYIPSMSLQLLVENALKHNVASREKPLHILVRSEKGCIIVENNLQERDQAGNSTAKGLKNLHDRLSLLTDSVPSFGIVNDRFVAKIPVIEKPDA